jgi:hypothetical protein
MDILVARPGVDRVARPLLATSFDEQEPSLSPDGRWIAYVSNETGVDEVFVRPFPDVEAGKWQVSSGGGTSSVWSGDGRELFFWGASRSMNAVDFRGVPPTPGPSRVLFTAPVTVRLGRPGLTADGRFLAVRDVRIRPTEERRELVLVQNFFAEVRAASARRRGEAP